MKIKKINLHLLHQFNDLDDLTFMSLIGSKLWRVCNIPLKYKNSSIYRELIEVLNTLCIRKHDGVYYFRFRDDEAILDVMETLAHMGVNVIMVQSEKHGRDQCGFPIPEYLN